MRQNFKNLDIYAAFQPKNGMEWQKANGIEPNWKTPEHIEVKPVYTKEDLEGMEHLDFAAGIPPYLRGPYSVMYTLRPWTIRQYAVSVKLQVFVTNIPNSFSQQSNVVLFCSKPSSKGNSNSAIQRVFTFIISP